VINLKSTLSEMATWEVQGRLIMSVINTGWGGQSWTKTIFFSQYIGLHVILKLILGLKSTVLCGLDPWLTTHSILTSFFLATA
jgi:hypothetical protein